MATNCLTGGSRYKKIAAVAEMLHCKKANVARRPAVGGISAKGGPQEHLRPHLPAARRDTTGGRTDLLRHCGNLAICDHRAVTCRPLARFAGQTDTGEGSGVRCARHVGKNGHNADDEGEDCGLTMSDSKKPDRSTRHPLSDRMPAKYSKEALACHLFELCVECPLPVRHDNSKQTLQAIECQARVSRAPCPNRIILRGDRKDGIDLQCRSSGAQAFYDLGCKSMPARLARCRQMRNTTSRCEGADQVRTADREQSRDCVSDRARRCGCAGLVTDDSELLPLSRQTHDRAQKVFALRGIDPRRAHDQVRPVRGPYQLLAGKLARTYRSRPG
jgi:hypothetical protein